ncbi:Hsp20/alpha crystallin family protein [Nocardioides mangrovi]|uniref:Hsp20/alpha crystallin family protein n=1 Tax=Nocardioides mangrovi TaxID=2874580 RepID=A0ABS7U7P6_9ACTN|nr:Hsp20/alpha crystallin family protein [Nocardioides mangrovi]MBZ5736966.1 Hsp20/alpha crystallin family protein [Nocardioides mangrovi]
MSTMQRNGQSLVGELMSWMGAAAEPDIRIEEYVEDDRRVVRADLPGIDPSRDLQLTVEGGVLRLRGERRSEHHDQHHTELRYGSFERVMTLPPGTTAQDVTADYADGVLTVRTPLQPSVESARIPITHRELPAE